MLQNYQTSGKIIFGSTIELLNTETNEKKTYKIVGKGRSRY